MSCLTHAHLKVQLGSRCRSQELCEPGVWVRFAPMQRSITPPFPTTSLQPTPLHHIWFRPCRWRPLPCPSSIDTICRARAQCELDVRYAHASVRACVQDVTAATKRAFCPTWRACTQRTARLTHPPNVARNPLCHSDAALNSAQPSDDTTAVSAATFSAPNASQREAATTAVEGARKRQRWVLPTPLFG
jgi:hypothetical protein